MFKLLIRIQPNYGNSGAYRGVGCIMTHLDQEL